MLKKEITSCKVFQEVQLSICSRPLISAPYCPSLPPDPVSQSDKDDIILLYLHLNPVLMSEDLFRGHPEVL